MGNKLQKRQRQIKSKKDNRGVVDQIELPTGTAIRALISSGGKVLIGSIPGLNKFFQVVETINQKVREEKLEILLSEFVGRFENIESAMGQLQKFFQHREGLILFQKIIHILDNEIINDEWADVLANVLKTVSDSDVKEQFTKHSYILAQIDQLSPHALLLLHKYDSWSKVKFTGSTTMSGQTIVGDWDSQITKLFCANTNTQDGTVKERIRHAFNDLDGRSIFKITEGKGVLLTQVGQEIYNYIS